MSNWDVLDYIDSMLVVDKDYNVLHAYRFNSPFGSLTVENRYEEFVGTPVFKLYTDIEPSESTITECFKTGEIITREKQRFTSVIDGQTFVTNNITLPIIRFGEIVGVVELSQDITSVGDLDGRGNKRNEKRAASIFVKETGNKIGFDDIITNNTEMLQCIAQAKVFALTGDPILICGETGTGKEMFVEAIVNENKERRKKFVVQNCAAIPENLVESILFGSTKGAFTGAENKIGLFEMADGGVLFLDELNSMPFHLQPKLLRVLQDGKIRPIGSQSEKTVDVKVIAASNKNPLMLIKEHLLREDLFYRLSSNMLNLTALRDRKEDIPLYIDYFVSKFNTKYGKKSTTISPDLRDILLRYNWPGNVRELRHVLETIINLSDGKVLTINNLPAYLTEAINSSYYDSRGSQDSDLNHHFRMSLREMVENKEKEYIIRALTASAWNVTKAAKLLKVPRQTLKFRMDKLQISKPQHVSLMALEQ